jgi:hypothetical protein
MVDGDHRGKIPRQGSRLHDHVANRQIRLDAWHKGSAF